MYCILLTTSVKIYFTRCTCLWIKMWVIFLDVLEYLGNPVQVDVRHSLRDDKWQDYIGKTSMTTVHHGNTPKSKVHGANMGPIWGRQDSGGPHVGPMNFAIWDHTSPTLNYTQPHTVTSSGCFHVEHTLELEKMPLWHKNYFLLSHKKTWRKYCSRVQMCDTNHLHLQGLNWSVTSQLSSTTYKTCPPTRVQWILVRIPRKVYGPLTRYVKLRVAKLAILRIW